MNTYNPGDYLDLYDFRLRVFDMYRARDDALRHHDDPDTVWRRFVLTRNALFADDPQSALTPAQRKGFPGLEYFPYNPDACVEAIIDPAVKPQELLIGTSGQETMTMRRVAAVRFSLDGKPATLSLYWIDVYGGGLFLPFRDASSPAESYGGGRYICDTVKGNTIRPLPAVEGQQRVLLDFNYAYNPSCAYHHRWVCPLAPAENRLQQRIAAGEKKFQ